MNAQPQTLQPAAPPHGDPGEEKTRLLEGLIDLGLGVHEEEPPSHFVSWMPRAGERVGRYVLVRQLGEGGFGVVWLAEQRDDIIREVALKLIKPGMDSRQVISRFEAERQALALMDHPSIAQVLDAGTAPDAHPFFVMELVRGVPITEYCDTRKLSITARLQLFAHVCLAVQHAHQKAILHRDLKPSNILIEEVDGEATPKIIDFGIAKALGSATLRGTRTSSMVTGRWTVVGTPQYMSPEQASNAQDVDACSDTYSLGAILFELLTGRTPIPAEIIAKLPPDEVFRRIRDIDAPKPSSIFTTAADPEALAKIAAARQSDARHLGQELQGDLDWITLKALENDRRRRYESASALTQDIRRYLSHEVILARPPTTRYILGKLIRRNQAAFISGAFITLALLTGATLAIFAYVKRNEALNRTLTAEAQALAEQQQRQLVSRFFEDNFQDTTLQRSGALTPTAIRDLLQAADERRLSQLKDDPEIDAPVSLMIAEAHLEQNSLEKAAALFQHSLTLLREQPKAEPLTIARCTRKLARCRLRHHEETGGSFDAASTIVLIDESIAIYQLLTTPQREELWEAQALRAGILRSSGRLDDTVAQLDEMNTGPESEALRDSRAYGWFKRESALIAAARGDHAGALDALDTALILLKGDPEQTQNQARLIEADISRIRADVRLTAGDLDAALAAATQENESRKPVLGHDDPHALMRAAKICAQKKDFAGAETRLNAALLVARESFSSSTEESCLRELRAVTIALHPQDLALQAAASTRLARIILAQADETLLATGTRDDSRIAEAAALLPDEISAAIPAGAEASGFFETRASIAARKEDFAAAIRDLHMTDTTAARARCAVFALAMRDAAAFETEKSELISRLHKETSAEDFIETCRVALLGPVSDTAQLDVVRSHLQNTIGQDVESDRLALIMGMIEFRAGDWSTSRYWLETASRSERPEIAVPAQFIAAIVSRRLNQPEASAALATAIAAYEEQLAPAIGTDSTPAAHDIWFARLLKTEAETALAK